MTELLLLDELVKRLRKLFTGYTLLNKSGLLHEVNIFAQYMPQPAALTVGKGVANYTEEDYENNFPCVVVKLGESIDREEMNMNTAAVNVKLLIGAYDGIPSGLDADAKKEYEKVRRQCQGYRDVLNIQERIREEFLNDRVTAQRFRMLMPLKSRLLESDTWPLYLGEMDLVFECGRPMQRDFVYKMKERVIRDV